MNNFIKSVLINLYVRSNDNVLDLGCGKGGDFLKFSKIDISYYGGLDNAEQSIEECERRHLSFGCPFNSSFKVQDLYTEIFDLNNKFNVISIQFSFHYAFESERSFFLTIKNIKNHLLKHGYLLLTVPDKNVILRRYNRHYKSSQGKNEDCSIVIFGNQYYQIEFLDTVTSEIFGGKYYFWLQEAINKCVEFLVDMDFLIKEMKKNDFVLIENANFLDFYNTHKGRFINLKKKTYQEHLKRKKLQLWNCIELLL